MSKTNQIIQVLHSYFEENKSVKIIPVKDMMPYFILAGVFNKDTKNGLPIRAVLRRLDANNQLHLIPYVYAERKTAKTNWYFQRSSGSIAPKVNPKVIQPKGKAETKSKSRKDSDEQYVLNLCDAVLKLKGLRQHRFDFLLGDSGTKLPVDSYYPDLNLVIEYKEQQHTKPNAHFDKPNKLTVSGVHRGEQRKIYDQRRLDVLPKHGITVIEISYSDFEFDRKDRIVRGDGDLEKIKTILKNEK
jgi:hypothetical protein